MQCNGRNADDVTDATTTSVPAFWPLHRLLTFLAFVASCKRCVSV